MSIRRRSLAVLSLAALAAPIGAPAALAAPGEAIPPVQQSVESLCQHVLQTDPFTDSSGTVFERNIECLFAAAITEGGAGGRPADQFAPTLSVSREAMATFLARLLDAADALDAGDVLRPLPPYDGTPAFSDVPPNDLHFESIHRLEQAGIVKGGDGGESSATYSPDALIDRAQMASFLNRALDFLTGVRLMTDSDYYVDDESTAIHEGSINAVTAVGIAVGDGKDRYSPDADVLRGQMSGFLTRLLAVLEAQGLITPLAPDSSALRAAVDEAAVVEHLEAFQAIADANGDTRASGTTGYEDSAAYVADQMTTAGYEVSIQEFEFPFFQELEPAELEADGEPLETAVFTYSGSGDVSAQVVPVDVQQPPPAEPGSTSGCEPEDFADFPEGAIALLQRGTCPFLDKAVNAEAAGAVAAIVYNEGQEGRTELVEGTLGEPAVEIPVVGASYEDGLLLLDSAQARVVTDTIAETRTTRNVLAESPTGDDSNVVMLGAHLDSVIEGPGINDNGSGSAGLIEVAKQAAALQPTNTLRFAWWGAEELGLLGAEHYVAELTPEQRDAIALYLNFDMIGSPNFVRFVYDGDGSAADAGPQGSAAIEYLFADFFAGQGLASEPTEFSGRSDYGPFIAEGVDIPSGGLFTGAEGIKTEREAEIYGGEAGIAYDPNYHQAGDTVDNVDATVIGQNIDAIAHALVVFGGSTTGVYDLSMPVRESGPGTSPGEGSQGGLHHDHALSER